MFRPNFHKYAKGYSAIDISITSMNKKYTSLDDIRVVIKMAKASQSNSDTFNWTDSSMISLNIDEAIKLVKAIRISNNKSFPNNESVVKFYHPLQSDNGNVNKNLILSKTDEKIGLKYFETPSKISVGIAFQLGMEAEAVATKIEYLIQSYITYLLLTDDKKE